jgi:6,7-dimethyl-8-ribityllumazine synthase
MSSTGPPRPEIAKAKRTFHIVAGRFNAGYVDGLVEHATQELRALAPDATISLYRVPGAFEIPVVVRELASRESTDAVIACGVIMQGETNHAQNLSRCVTDALQRIAVDQAVPVINVVLSFDNESRARARCLENKINRGTEAARTALQIVQTLSQIRSEQGAAVSQPPKGRLKKRPSSKPVAQRRGSS